MMKRCVSFGAAGIRNHDFFGNSLFFMFFSLTDFVPLNGCHGRRRPARAWLSKDERDLLLLAKQCLILGDTVRTVVVKRKLVDAAAERTRAKVRADT